VTTNAQILELLRHTEPLQPHEVATRLCLPPERVKKAMARMARAGHLANDGGWYSFPTGDTSTDDAGDIGTADGDICVAGALQTGPRIRMTEHESWEDPPRVPRWVERWFG